jgi:hypothetical protein
MRKSIHQIRCLTLHSYTALRTSIRLSVLPYGSPYLLLLIFLKKNYPIRQKILTILIQLPKILSTSLNKFRELTSPADLHIYRISERAISSSPADSYIGLLINVRVRWTRKTLSLVFSTNVRVRWTRNNSVNLFNVLLKVPPFNFFL